MLSTDRRPGAVADRRVSVANEPLFRSEVLAEQQAQWLGTVLLAPRISHRLFAAFAALATAAVLALLFLMDYTRTARISGWLVPEQGLVQIFAPEPGVVTRLNVREGAQVRKGTPLLALSTELQSEALGATQEEIVRQLARRRDSLAAERGLQEELYRQQVEGLTHRLAALRSEQEHLDRELDLQRARLRLAEDARERLRPLRERGWIAEPRWQQAENDRLDQALRLRALQRERAVADRERLALQAELGDLPLKHRTQLAGIDRGIAALEQELAQAEARREIVIPAPEDGTVTVVQVEQGGNAGTTVPVLSIVPAGSELKAQLLIPSSAIGFVRPGQRVLLRYEAFPYQRFGQHPGVVSEVSRSAASPSELTQRLAGLASLHGAAEPIYPVTVRLASQTVTAYGEPVPLQPGMQLEADVLLERRRLIEWVLDPVFTLTGKWHG